MKWRDCTVRVAKTKAMISFPVSAKLISAIVFTTWIVQSLYFLNPKFQASSHLLWLYSLVCVRPGRKPRKPVFSQRGSNNNDLICSLNFIVLSKINHTHSYPFLDMIHVLQIKRQPHMSLLMRKLAFCISKNKDADQLCRNRTADQRLCLRYIDSTIPVLSKSKIPSF